MKKVNFWAKVNFGHHQKRPKFHKIHEISAEILNTDMYHKHTNLRMMYQKDRRQIRRRTFWHLAGNKFKILLDIQIMSVVSNSQSLGSFFRGLVHKWNSLWCWSFVRFLDIFHINLVVNKLTERFWKLLVHWKFYRFFWWCCLTGFLGFPLPVVCIFFEFWWSICNFRYSILPIVPWVQALPNCIWEERCPLSHNILM